eukprot:4267626-Prymnesium_polylepis.1
MKRGAGSTSVRKSSTGGWVGAGPCGQGDEYATRRPGEEEDATRGIATGGASVSARPDAGGRRLNASPKADHPAKGREERRARLKR